MCGIVGYTGRREAEPILLAGLQRLEYRGYDSAGLATLSGRRLHLRKSAGRIARLAGDPQRRIGSEPEGIRATIDWRGRRSVGRDRGGRPLRRVSYRQQV